MMDFYQMFRLEIELRLGQGDNIPNFNASMDALDNEEFTILHMELVKN